MNTRIAKLFLIFSSLITISTTSTPCNNKFVISEYSSASPNNNHAKANFDTNNHTRSFDNLAQNKYRHLADINSPDMNWRIKYKNSKYPIIVESEDEKIVFQESGSLETGENVVTLDWFPDSSGFILWAADSPQEINDYGWYWADRLILYKIDTVNKLLHHTIVAPVASKKEGFMTWPRNLAWSPDGSKFAVVENIETIYVIDRNGQIIRISEPSLGKEEYWYWSILLTNDSLLFSTIQSPYKQKPGLTTTNAIWKVNLEKEDTSEKKIMEEVDYVEFVGKDPNSAKILIYRPNPENFPCSPNELVIYNLETNEIEKTLLRNITNLSSSSSKDKTVLALNFSKCKPSVSQSHIIESENILVYQYIYYWQYGELVEKSEKSNFSYSFWDETKNGFNFCFFNWNDQDLSYDCELVTP